MKNDNNRRKDGREKGGWPLGEMKGLRMWRLPYYLFPASAFLLLSLVLTGCGNDLHDTIPVSGVVTFDGKAPPFEGILIFAHRGRPTSALFDAQGRYTAKAFNGSDGLVPGKYIVRIECWKQALTMEGPPEISHVPEGFEPPELVVSSDKKRIEYNINVPTE